MASLIIVCGLPGSGKTEAASRLADIRGAQRFNAEEWMEVLGLSRWDGGARTRVEELQWKVAKELLDLGISVIVEWGTWVRAERDRLWSEARELGADVELCALDALDAERCRRLEARAARLMGLPGPADLPVLTTEPSGGPWEEELEAVSEAPAEVALVATPPAATARDEEVSLWREVFEPPDEEELARYDKVLVGVGAGVSSLSSGAVSAGVPGKNGHPRPGVDQTQVLSRWRGPAGPLTPVRTEGFTWGDVPAAPDDQSGPQRS